MSILKDVLIEEYWRASDIASAIKDELSSLPKGSLQVKRRGDRQYYHLQRREGSRVVSQYIRLENVDDVKKQLARRHVLETALEERMEDLEMIKRALKGVPER